MKLNIPDLNKYQVLALVLTFNYQITKPGSPARELLILRVMGRKLLNYQILDDNVTTYITARTKFS